MTFNHYTVPTWFAASGGMLRPDRSDLFAQYCRQAAEQLTDGIHAAFTLNEHQAAQILETVFNEKQNPAFAAAAAKAVGSDQFQSWKTVDPGKGVPALIAAHKQGCATIKSVRSDLPVGVCLATLDYRGIGPDNQAAAMHRKVDEAWLEAAKSGEFLGVQNYWPVFFDRDGGVAPETVQDQSLGSRDRPHQPRELRPVRSSGYWKAHPRDRAWAG